MNVLLKNLKAEHAAYFDACARIRNITTTRLFTRLVEVIADDQLVLGILDDEGSGRRQKGEQRYRAPKEARQPA